MTFVATDTVGNQSGLTVPVTLELIVTDGDISAPSSLDFGTVLEGTQAEKILIVTNTGQTPLVVSQVVIDNPAFMIVLSPLDVFPLKLDPGESRSLKIAFKPQIGTGGTTITGELTLTSDDPDEGAVNVNLSGSANPLDGGPINSTILGARILEVITSQNCNDVSGEVDFSAESSGTDTFQVILTDQGGKTSTSGVFPAASPMCQASCRFLFSPMGEIFEEKRDDNRIYESVQRTSGRKSIATRS